MIFETAVLEGWFLIIIVVLWGVRLGLVGDVQDSPQYVETGSR